MSLIVLYVSVTTIVCLISGRRVAASRRSTGTTKHLVVPRSMPAKHHCFFMTLPLWYFLLVRSVLPISTTLPGPPIFKGCQKKQLQKKNSSFGSKSPPKLSSVLNELHISNSILLYEALWICWRSFQIAFRIRQGFLMSHNWRLKIKLVKSMTNRSNFFRWLRKSYQTLRRQIRTWLLLHSAHKMVGRQTSGIPKLICISGSDLNFPFIMVAFFEILALSFLPLCVNASSIHYILPTPAFKGWSLKLNNIAFGPN